MEAEQADGSIAATVTETEAVSQHQLETAPSPISPRPSGSILLVGRRSMNTERRISWDASVIDNEGMSKKKSKVCCIYKKSGRYDESSDENNNSDENDSESEPNAYEKQPKPKQDNTARENSLDFLGPPPQLKKYRSPQRQQDVPNGLKSPPPQRKNPGNDNGLVRDSSNSDTTMDFAGRLSSPPPNRLKSPPPIKLNGK